MSKHIFRPGDLVAFKDSLNLFNHKQREFVTLSDYETSKPAGRFGGSDVGMVIRKDDGGMATLILTSNGHLGCVSQVFIERIK